MTKLDFIRCMQPLSDNAPIMAIDEATGEKVPARARLTTVNHPDGGLQVGILIHGDDETGAGRREGKTK